MGGDSKSEICAAELKRSGRRMTFSWPLLLIWFLPQLNAFIESSPEIGYRDLLQVPPEEKDGLAVDNHPGMLQRRTGRQGPGAGGIQVPEIRSGRPVGNGPAPPQRRGQAPRQRPVEKPAPGLHPRPQPRQQREVRFDDEQNFQQQQRQRERNFQAPRKVDQQYQMPTREVGQQQPRQRGQRDYQQPGQREPLPPPASRQRPRQVNRADPGEYQLEQQRPRRQRRQEYEEEEYQEAPAPVARTQRIRVPQNAPEPRRRNRQEYYEEQADPVDEDRLLRRQERAQARQYELERQHRRMQREQQQYEIMGDEMAEQPRQGQHRLRPDPRQQQRARGRNRQEAEYEDEDAEAYRRPEPLTRQRQHRPRTSPQKVPTVRDENQVLQEALRLMEMGQAEGKGSIVLEEYVEGDEDSGFLQVNDEEEDYNQGHKSPRTMMAPPSPPRPHRQAQAAARARQGRSPQGENKVPRQEQQRNNRFFHIAERKAPVTSNDYGVEEEESSDEDGPGSGSFYVPFPTWMDYMKDVQELSSDDLRFNVPRPGMQCDAKDIFTHLSENPAPIQSQAIVQSVHEAPVPNAAEPVAKNIFV